VGNATPGFLKGAPGKKKKAGELDLMDPSAAGTNAGAGIRVGLFAKNDKPLAALILGKYHEKKSADGPMPCTAPIPTGAISSNRANRHCFVADTLDDFSPDAKSWLSTEILNVPARTCARSRSPGQQRGVRLLRDASTGELKAEGLSPAEELENYKANALASGLSYLTFADIAAPAVSESETGMDKPVDLCGKDEGRALFHGARRHGPRW